jgi:hypothetical protein
MGKVLCLDCQRSKARYNSPECPSCYVVRTIAERKAAYQAKERAIRARVQRLLGIDLPLGPKEG